MMNRRNVSNFCIAILGFALLSGCDSSEPDVSELVLPVRQALALDNSRILAEIFINGGQLQEFFLEPNQQSDEISVAGIRENETNSIRIVWWEVYNGIQVGMAIQSQEFFAGGNVTIDSPHDTNVFDSDRDGISNYDERLANSCVFYHGSLCFQDGIVDVPTSPAAAQGVAPDLSFDFGNSVELVRNGDGGFGVTDWESDYGLRMVDGTFCTTMEAGPVPTQYPVLNQLTSLPAGEYYISFDVKSTRQNATMNFNMWSSTGIAPVYQFVEPLSQNWETRQLKATVTADFDGGISLNAIINPFETTTYCFDNISVLRAL